ncbi:MAG: dephospho-CoA kinase [Eubacterium sp.]|nr:dephospho-CoA kinase [Eubacterium sp.]
MFEVIFIVVGLTGISGAGKTTACNIFKTRGFHIVDDDKIAFETVKPGTPCFKEIINYFGEEVISDSGELNRSAIAEKVFDNPQIKIEYEQIVFPYINYKVISIILNNSEKFILLDAPTLFESGENYLCDYIISVITNKENAVSRILKRDGISAAEAEKRLSSQKSRAFYCKNCDFLIDNDRDIETYKKSISDIIDKIMESI